MSNSNENQQPRFKDESWDEQVECADLLREIQHAVSRFMVLDDYQVTAVSLWILHTYFILKPKVPQLFVYSPILHITSPVPQCGKSTLFDILEQLVNNPFSTMGASEPSIFRRIELQQPTLMLDEFDNFDIGTRKSLLAMLNSGYKQNGIVSRMALGKSKNWDEFQDFSTWCPKVLCGIGNLPDNLSSRCITIKLRRKLSVEKTESINTVLRNNPDYFNNLRRKIVSFVTRYEEELLSIDFAPPSELDDRAQNNWEGLFKLANFIDDENELPNALQASVKISNSTKSESTSLSTELIKDIKEYLEELSSDFISSNSLVANIKAKSDRPWLELNFKGLTCHSLAEMLKPFGVLPRQQRVNGQTLRGYDRTALEGIILRYL